ncbi:MAG TPA: NnrS family protein [Methylomirabilota bacterium]|nr:NnrS family protein [Methylomirabilota bacterium]
MHVKLGVVERRCPRRRVRRNLFEPSKVGRWVSFADLHREPFRLFFPAATVAGLIGIALWPLLLLGWREAYPGPSHARLMVQGFFGGFVFGFLGTALPRMLEARPLAVGEVLFLFALFVGNVVAQTLGLNTLGDGVFVGEIVFLFCILLRRWCCGADRPPPSFVLAGLALCSAVVGTGIQLMGRRWELSPAVELLGRLFGYHGFVILCVLGAGGFVLPRFLGLGARRRFAASTLDAGGWNRAARIAAATGAMILLTYALEAAGWHRAAGLARAVLVVAYLAREMPLERLRWSWQGVRWQMIVGMACVPIGAGAAGWFPSMRTTWWHVELMAGFSLITLAVATHVVFGHSGARERLGRFRPQLTGAGLLVLCGLVSRVSGDFLPGIQVSHYLYGAACWMAGVLVWAATVLPRVLRPDPEAET